jgi:hypothetical protein
MFNKPGAKLVIALIGAVLVGGAAVGIAMAGGSHPTKTRVAALNPSGQCVLLPPSSDIVQNPDKHSDWQINSTCASLLETTGTPTATNEATVTPTETATAPLATETPEATATPAATGTPGNDETDVEEVGENETDHADATTTPEAEHVGTPEAPHTHPDTEASRGRGSEHSEGD